MTRFEPHSRHGIRTREQACQAGLLERLERERNCGRETLDEIARWLREDGESATFPYHQADARVA